MARSVVDEGLRRVFPAAADSEREALGMAVGRVLAEWDELDFALGFGSFFEGLPYRDLDVALHSRDGRPLDEATLAAIGRACERVVRLPVDVVDLVAASLPLRFWASRGIALLVRDPERLAHWKERTWLAYWDMAWMYRQQWRDLVRP